MEAATSVLDNYELLENILLHLPVLDLLLAERVSKTFQGLIAQSEEIRQALFLVPTSTSASVAFSQPSVHAADQSLGNNRREWSTADGTVLRPIINPFIAQVTGGFDHDLGQGLNHESKSPST